MLQINLIPGQTVVVKCPVENISRKLLYWSKGSKLVRFSGRKRAKMGGGLYIRRASPEHDDAGVYTCIAGSQKATVTVNFIE